MAEQQSGPSDSHGLTSEPAQTYDEFMVEQQSKQLQVQQMQQEQFAQAWSEPRGFLHTPEGTNPHYHYPAQKSRQETRNRGRKMTRGEYLSRQQARWARHPRPNLPNQPIDPYGGTGDMAKRDWFSRFWFTLFGYYPY